MIESQRVNIMIYYKIPTQYLPHIKFMSKEHLYDNRPHATRTLSETVIYILTEGSLTLESDGEIVEMLPGDAHIFSKGEFQRPIKITECKYYYIHLFDEFDRISMTSEQELDFYSSAQQFFLKSNPYTINFSSDNFNDLTIPRHFSIAGSPYSAQIKNCLKESKLTISTVKSEFYNFHANLKVAELFYFLYLTYSETQQSVSGIFNEITAKKIIEYVNKNMGKRITGKELENEFGYSFDHMNRRFKEIIGENIFNYSLKSRVNQAKVLLYTKKISVTQVSEMTGFCNIYHFSKMFKKFTGMTPTEYVRLNKSQQQIRKPDTER